MERPLRPSRLSRHIEARLPGYRAISYKIQAPKTFARKKSILSSNLVSCLSFLGNYVISGGHYGAANDGAYNAA